MTAEVVTVQDMAWPLIVRTQGSLVADEVAVVGVKVAGRVSDVYVDLGDPVKQDQPLVTLDQADFEFQVEQAESQLQQAFAAVGLSPGDDVSKLNPENAPPVRQEKALWNEAIANLNRIQQLRTRNAVTESELDQVLAAERVSEARYDSAINSVREKIALIGVRRAELQLARERLQQSTIRAPFDGIVQQRHVAQGVYAQVGNAAVTVVRTNPLRYRGSLPERHAQQLRLGQEIRLQIESVAEQPRVKVTRISPALDELSRSLLFEAVIDNGSGALRTGLFAEAEVVLDPQAKTLAVPRSAVTEFAGAEKVWKIVDGVAREVVIQTGDRRDNAIGVRSGLEVGDVILLNGSAGRVARIEAVKTSQTAALANEHSALAGEHSRRQTGADAESSSSE